MLRSKILSLTFQHLGCYGVRFLLNFQTCLMLCWKALSLTFNHLGWHALRPVLNFQLSWVLRCQVLSPIFRHVGWYAASSRRCRTKTRTTTAETKCKFWLRWRFFLQPIHWWSTSKLRRAWFLKFDTGMTMEFEPSPVKVYPLHQWWNGQ